MRIEDDIYLIYSLRLPARSVEDEFDTSGGGAVTLVLVVDAGCTSSFHRDWRARLGNELLRGLVQAHQRVIGIVRPRVDGQHIFHSGYEGAVGLRRDDPALPAMRLETVFLSVRPIVELLARSTMSSSTTLLSSRRNVQRARPFGGLEHENVPG